MNIEIYPLVKVECDGFSIYFGMEQAVVEAAIGPGEELRKRHYYYRDEMAIDYSGDGKVEFIEFLGGIDGELRPAVYGVSVFDTPADELAAILKQKNGGTIDASEGEYAHMFHSISVGVYRETTPVDVAEMVEEMKADGTFVDDYEIVQEERRRTNHWSTIGFGAAGYYG